MVQKTFFLYVIAIYKITLPPINSKLATCISEVIVPVIINIMQGLLKYN